METPLQLSDGTVISTGIPTTRQSTYGGKGLMVRGVVVQVYSLDDDGQGGPSGFGDEKRLSSSAVVPDGGPPAMYCDVLTYSVLPGAKDKLLTRVLIPSGRGGLHEGHIWLPRPAQMNIQTGRKVALTPDGSVSKVANPADLDGDHVLIGFMDNELDLPILLTGIPHPKADIGRELGATGSRTKIRALDGASAGGPDYYRYRGITYGVSEGGNFLIDASGAHQGQYLPDGSEPPTSNDGRSGNVTIRTQAGAALRIEGTSSTLTLDDDGDFAIDTIQENGQNSRLVFSPDGTLTLRHYTGIDDSKHTAILIHPNGNMVTSVGADVDEEIFTGLMVTSCGEEHKFVEGTSRTFVDEDILIDGSQDLTMDITGLVHLGRDPTDAVVLGDKFKKATDDYATAIDTAVASYVQALTAPVQVIDKKFTAGFPAVVITDLQPLFLAWALALPLLQQAVAAAAADYAGVDYLSDDVDTK